MTSHGRHGRAALCALFLPALLVLETTPALAQGGASPPPSAAPPASAATPPPAAPSASASAKAPPASAPAVHQGAPPASAPPAKATSAATPPSQPTVVNGAAANLAPFGPGVRVTVETTKLTKVYVAHALPDGSTPPIYDFTHVGTAPLSMQLPPGTYDVAVENEDVSRADHVVHVGTKPVVLDVKAGSSGLGSVGTLTLGVGVLSVLAATVILISGSDAPAGIDKPKLVIPLYAAGGGLVIGGLTMYLVSRTSIEERHGPLPPPAPRSAAGLGLRARFAF